METNNKTSLDVATEVVKAFLNKQANPFGNASAYANCLSEIMLISQDKSRLLEHIIALNDIFHDAAIELIPDINEEDMKKILEDPDMKKAIESLEKEMSEND